tara:strand:- start:87 stop:497 length:411 start_codon:yes stop_codon:yes gene_type:complete
MADRNTPAAATFEEWRVEFNELATDVGDINNLPSTINGQNVTDVIEAITQVNAGLSNVLFPNVIDFDDSPNVNNERIKMGNSDDLQIFHDSNNSIIQHSGTGSLQLKSDSVTLTFPNTGGNISTEGFSIAVAVALG